MYCFAIFIYATYQLGMFWFSFNLMPLVSKHLGFGMHMSHQLWCDVRLDGWLPYCIACNVLPAMFFCICLTFYLDWFYLSTQNSIFKWVWFLDESLLSKSMLVICLELNFELFVCIYLKPNQAHGGQFIAACNPGQFGVPQHQHDYKLYWDRFVNGMEWNDRFLWCLISWL